MERWDIVLLAIAAYMAVRSLVRLMMARRNELARELLAEAERSRRAKAGAQGSGASERAGR